VQTTFVVGGALSNDDLAVMAYDGQDAGSFHFHILV
jgi:hypothetical protein